MEDLQAGVGAATAEAPSVGPASEQLAAVSPGLTGVNQADQVPRRDFVVPEAHWPAIEALAMEETEWDIRMQCANNRRRTALSAGDAETTIIEMRNTINAGKAHDVAKLAVESELRAVIPEIPEGGRVNLTIPEFKVRWIG